MCLIVFLALLSSADAVACNIPVFRYALERWKPDACEIIIFHNAELSAENQSIVNRLRERTRENEGHANAKVISVSLADRQDAPRAELWHQLRENEQAELPYVMVRTKLGRGNFVNHWHGSLGQVDRIGLFESPARERIRDRLLAGHSVVWLLIGSDDPQKNDDATRLAEATFGTLHRHRDGVIDPERV